MYKRLTRPRIRVELAIPASLGYKLFKKLLCHV